MALSTQATTNDYWISPNALYIELNAMGNPDYIQASCISGAQILVYVRGIIGYDAGHNYQRWQLQASPTVFNTHTTKYVYAAIPRNNSVGRNAFIAFPSELIDIYGKNENEEQIGSANYYYINLQGIITSSGENGSEPREWYVDRNKVEHRVETGVLSSDEAIAAGPTDTEWYKYDAVDGIITFLKDLTIKTGKMFLSLYAKMLTIKKGGSISFENQSIAVTGIADVSTPVTENDKIVTPVYVAHHFLSRIHEDTAQQLIKFLKGIKIGNDYVIDEFGNAVLRSLKIGEHGIQENGNAVLGNVTVDRTHSTGSTEADRAIIGGEGFDLYMGEDGKSHLYVDYVVARVKAFFAQLEIRKVSYSGGTTLFSNAGSTIAKVVAVYNADKTDIVAYKCYAVADDGTTRTRNWWKVGMMALCQTFNVSSDTQGNRYYWRLVVGTGQETLEDGKLYDYVLLSDVKEFGGTDKIIPSYGTSLFADENGNVLQFAGFALGVTDSSDMTSIASALLAEGITEDDANTPVGNRIYYGYEDGSDVPLPGDVIVQAGDEVRWNSYGNVIRIATSTEDNATDNAPSITMYHGIGKPSDEGVWQWKDVVSIQSPEGWIVNAKMFRFFTASGDENSIAELMDDVAHLQIDADNITASVSSLDKSQQELTGRVAAVEIYSDKISLKVDRSQVQDRNLLGNALVREFGCVYGFVQRSVKLEKGKVYTMSVRGFVSPVLSQRGGKLVAYVWTEDANGAWTWLHSVEIAEMDMTTRSVTFDDVPTAGSFKFGVFPSPRQDNGGGCYVEYAQIEEGDSATALSRNVNDADVHGNMLPELIQGGKWLNLQGAEIIENNATVDGYVVNVAHIQTSRVAKTMLQYTEWVTGNGSYSVSFIARGSGKVTISVGGGCRYAINDNGNVSTLSNGVISFTLSDEWTKHWVTFSLEKETGATTLSVTAAAGSDVWVGGLKAEQYGRVTDYINGEVSVQRLKATGIDIQKNEIKVTTDNFNIYNKREEKIFGVDALGNVSMKHATMGGMISKTPVTIDGDVAANALFDVYEDTLALTEWYDAPKLDNMYGIYYITGNTTIPFDIMMPSVDVEEDGSRPYQISEEELRKIRCLVGNTVIIYNDSDRDVKIRCKSSTFSEIWIKTGRTAERSVSEQAASSGDLSAERIEINYNPFDPTGTGDINTGLAEDYDYGDFYRYIGNARQNLVFTLEGGKHRFISLTCVCEVSHGAKECIYWIGNYGNGGI